MVFNSIFFIFCFLPVFMLIYYLVPGKLRNLLLFLGSLIFYAWGEPVYVILMLFSSVFNYYMGTELERLYYDDKKQKLNLVFAIIINLGILVFFKYYGFLLDTFGGITGIHISHPELSLPIGLSFYTFRNLSYLFDIYISKITAQQNFLTFATYSTMFPYTAAGPIIRYADIQEQLERRSVNISRFGAGTELFIKGLAKKVLLADNLSALYAGICSNTQMSVLTAWIGILTFTMQIYFDFSGYSDMAIGLGRMFGFEFKKNFDVPYISKSITEFWRRWHISLSSWFREYVYIPLGGNHVTISRNIVNLLIVWMLTGMWHGAAWNFIVWGIYYGVVLVLEKYVWGAIVDRWPSVLQHIYALVLVLVGWVFFFSPSLGAALRYLFAMVGGGAGFASKEVFFVILTHWLFYLLAVIGSTTLGSRMLRAILNVSENHTVRTVITQVVFFGMLAISVAYLIADTYNPFLYFRF